MLKAIRIGALAVALTGSWAALAHMPYVLPSVFDATGRSRITIEASFTEDAFRPEIAMEGASFEITGPDGRTIRLAAPVATKEVTLVEAALPADGLYRISSGQRLGRMGKMFRRGDAWVMAAEGAAAPAGATLVDVRSTTLADAYVARGKPGAMGALTPRGAGLEIQPLSDPSAYTPKSPAAFALLFNGKPLAGETVTLFREAGYYDGRKQGAAIRAGAAGKLSLTPDEAGRYLILVRHRDAAPPGAGAAYMSYTATLAFEVL